MDCTVIIPIGPGHEKIAEQAIESVIMASNEGIGRFHNIHIVAGDDTLGNKGRSKTRNECVFGIDRNLPRNAFVCSGLTAEEGQNIDALKSEWLFFLDADDLMCSCHTYGQSAFDVVSMYLDDYDCIWGGIYEASLEGRVQKRMGADWPIMSYQKILDNPFYLTCQMGHFVRRSVFTGFDEEREVCEDVVWYLHAWKNFRCIKQEKPFFLNRRGYHTWAINEDMEMPNGKEWSIEAERLRKEARDAS